MTTRKHRQDNVIFITTLILMAIGLIVIYAIGPMRANVTNSTYGTNYSSNYFFWHQALSVAIAMVALVVFRYFPYKKLRKWSKPMLIIAMAMQALLWILAAAGSSLAKCELGECRWFSLGGISIQPAEFLKLTLILWLADFMARKREEGVIGKWKEFWVPVGVVSGLSLVFVVFAQGDLGSGVAVAAIILGMLLAGGVSTKQYLILLAIVAIGGGLAIVSSSHRRERIDAWVAVLTGEEGGDSTYHIENAMLAIGTGGLFGVGIGNSVQATGYLPESINDSVFAVMGETFGFVGLVVILGLFATLLNRTLGVASKTRELDKRLVSVGVFSWLAAQVVVNVMAMTALMPVTGITLPLLSYGGTSMAFVAAGIGLVLQLSCYTEREEVKDENPDSRGRIRGAYHASRRRNA